MSSHWFEALADHAGAAYLRYSFTKGTSQEASFLVAALGLSPGMRVLDVGCGPGRHAHALAEQGMTVVGVDISARFVALAAEASVAGAAFVRGDARRLPVAAGSFDAAISLCQGGFGLLGDDDGVVLEEIMGALRPGGVAAVSAFSAYFQVRWLEETDTFSAETGVNHERTEGEERGGRGGRVRSVDDLLHAAGAPPAGRARPAPRSRTCGQWHPGTTRPRPPDLAHPEWLMLAAPTDALGGEPLLDRLDLGVHTPLQPRAMRSFSTAVGSVTRRVGVP